MKVANKVKYKNKKYSIMDYLDANTTLKNIKPKLRSIDIGEDLLALSCALYRLQIVEKNNHFAFSSLDHPDLIKQIKQQDRQLASEIKRFYEQKLIVLKLKGIELTKYRKDLEYFLSNVNSTTWDLDHQGRKSYPHEFIGLVYKLPYFYFYDLELLEMFGTNYVDIVGSNNFESVLELKFIKVLNPKKLQRPFVEYWFSDKDNNKVLFELQKENPLNELFLLHVIDKPVRIRSHYHVRKKDQMSFLVPYRTRWNIVF